MDLYIHLVILAIISGLNVWSDTDASCTKPRLNTNSYTVSPDKGSYSVNETYEIYCVPGYVTSDNIKLTCLSTSSWSSVSPTCTASEGTYPWWLLLVAVLVVVVVVACILPRLLHMCFGKKKKNASNDEEKNNLKRRDINGYDDDDDDDDDRSDSPVPDFAKSKHKRMTNLEFMAKLHKDADRKTLQRATKNAKF